MRLGKKTGRCKRIVFTTSDRRHSPPYLFRPKGQKKGLGRVKQTDERLVRAIHAQQKFALQTRWRTTGVPGVERGLFQPLPQSLQTIIKMLASRLWKILAQSFSTSHDPSPLQHACLFIQYIPRSPGKTC